MKLNKPQLLCKDNPNLDTLPYPVLVLPKLDGVRCLVDEHGNAVSRTLKPIPNDFIRNQIQEYPFLTGADGELIVGQPFGPTVYNDTQSSVMRHKGEPQFTYWIFDIWSSTDAYFSKKKHLDGWYDRKALPDFVRIVGSQLCFNANDVLAAEEMFIQQGYEGAIIRLDKPYKQGRTTMKELNAYKLKRFVDAEATIISYEPEYENTNEAFKNETGNTKRSTAQAGLKAKESLGSVTVTSDEFPGKSFSIGSGWTQSERATLWKNRQELIGKTIKYKYFPVGVKDVPRHPIALGFRDMEIDG